MYRKNYRRPRAAQFNSTIVSGEKVAATATFVEDEIIMPKTEVPSLVPSLIGIEILHPYEDKDTMAEHDYSKWHLSTKSQDDIIDLSDMDCIAAGVIEYTLATAVGIAIQNRVERITFPAPIPITSSKLFIGFKQVTGVSHTYQYRLYLAPRSIPGVVQQNNLTQSVQF